MEINVHVFYNGISLQKTHWKVGTFTVKRSTPRVGKPYRNHPWNNYQMYQIHYRMIASVNYFSENNNRIILKRTLLTTREASSVWRHTHFVHHYSWRNKRCRQKKIGIIGSKNQSIFRQCLCHRRLYSLKPRNIYQLKWTLPKVEDLYCRNEFTDRHNLQ